MIKQLSSSHRRQVVMSQRRRIAIFEEGQALRKSCIVDVLCSLVEFRCQVRDERQLRR